MSDLIKRSDAIKALRLEYPMMPMFKSLREEWAIKTEGFRKAEEVIMSIPSADRPQGEWIDAEIPLESGGSMPIQVCNLCKTFYPLAYTGGGHRFCPNCGARMKGADDERSR